MKTALAFLAALLCACSSTPYKAPPSTAPVQRSVNNARGNVDAALAENQAAKEGNRSARTKAALIDNKAAVIERYWK